MSTGVSGGTTGSLRIRKRASGIEVESAPERHEFPREFISRELNDAVRLYVVISSDPPLSYEVSAISDGFDFQGTKAPLPIQNDPPRKRRWWQRRNRV